MRLDDLWVTMRKGKDTLKQFKATLTIWKNLHFKMVEFYGKQRDRNEGE